MTNSIVKIDSELVDLYVSEYSRHVEGCIPDLMACDDSDPAGSIEDFASGYIFDKEYRGEVIPEIRIAAKKIAALYA